MDPNFQFKIGLRDLSPAVIYDPIRKKFTGSIGQYYNKQLEGYSPINYTIVWAKQSTFGTCDSVNCTGLLGLVQRGEVDFNEKLYSFSTIPDSITGLKPGPVLGDVSCIIISALPKVGIVREDIFKSLSIFTLDAIIFLSFVYLLLFSIPFILWFAESKFFKIKTNSPPIIWPFICAILRKESKIKTFNRRFLSFIWISITLTIFFITALYSTSFATDLTSKAPIKTIDSLEDVANCDRIPLFIEEPLCRTMVNRGSLRAQKEILRRGKTKIMDEFILEVYEKEEIERYVFIITAEEFEDVKLGYCEYFPSAPIPLWHQSTNSFPTDLLFTVLSSQLSPHATKIINQLHEKHFESGILLQTPSKWRFHFEKLLDPKQERGCLHKTSISLKPALYQFNQLEMQNYKLFFKHLLCTIPICILSLIGEYLYLEIDSAMTK